MNISKLLYDTLRYYGFNRKLAVLGTRLIMGIDDLDTIIRCNIISNSEYHRLKQAGII